MTRDSLATTSLGWLIKENAYLWRAWEAGQTGGFASRELLAARLQDVTDEMEHRAGKTRRVSLEAHKKEIEDRLSWWATEGFGAHDRPETRALTNSLRLVCETLKKLTAPATPSGSAGQ